jgi:hypothetical protein
MDLLSIVGLATKRREDYFSQAKLLVKKYKTREHLEQRMLKESKAIVVGLQMRQMRWEEYERTLLDKTLTSALAAVYLGAADSNPNAKMEKAWPIIVGDMLPPIVNFLSETKENLDNGTLRIGDTTLEFADGDNTSKQTWPQLLVRVIRYLATPTYSFFSLGDFLRREDQGYKEMRRTGLNDSRTCEDCQRFHNLGWQPIGTLPMPGRDCQCFDRCRCFIEYK